MQTACRRAQCAASTRAPGCRALRCWAAARPRSGPAPPAAAAGRTGCPSAAAPAAGRVSGRCALPPPCVAAAGLGQWEGRSGVLCGERRAFMRLVRSAWVCEWRRGARRRCGRWGLRESGASTTQRQGECGARQKALPCLNAASELWDSPTALATPRQAAGAAMDGLRAPARAHAPAEQPQPARTQAWASTYARLAKQAAALSQPPALPRDMLAEAQGFEALQARPARVLAAPTPAGATLTRSRATD